MIPNPQVLTLNRSLSLVWNSTSKTTGEMSFPKRVKACRLFSVTLQCKHRLVLTTMDHCLRPPWGRLGNHPAALCQLFKNILSIDLLREIIPEVSLGPP